MNNDKVNLIIEARDGRPLRAFRHEGKTFIESREDKNYQLRIKNKTGGRIKVVISVDSLSILTGKPSTIDPSETGYILGPYAEEVFKGYRINDKEVAEFTFVKKNKSYASEKGEGRNTGVIAIRAYSEKQNLPTYYLYNKIGTSMNHSDGITFSSTHIHTPTYGSQYTSSISPQSSDPLRCCNFVQESKSLSPSEAFEHGSSFGKITQEAVTYTSFEVGNLLDEVIIYYASLRGLKALGVKVTREKEVAFPSPFKREFCSPPRDWRG